MAEGAGTEVWDLLEQAGKQADREEIETGVLQSLWDGVKQTQNQSHCLGPGISESRAPWKRLSPRKNPVQEGRVSWMWWHTFSIPALRRRS